MIKSSQGLKANMQLAEVEMEIKFEFNPNHLQYFPISSKRISKRGSVLKVRDSCYNYSYIFDTTAYTKTGQKVDQTGLNFTKSKR